MVSLDPVQEELNRQSGILARRIVTRLIPGDNIGQEIAIEIVTRAFQHISRGSWTRVRSDALQAVRGQLLPRIGEERTQTFLNGAQRQINRIARERGINIPEDNQNWLTSTEIQAANSAPEHLRQENIRNAPLQLTPQEQEIQRRHRNHYIGAHGDAVNVLDSQRNRIVQQEQNWAQENFQFQGKSFYNLPWRPQLNPLNDKKQTMAKNKPCWRVQVAQQAAQQTHNL